MFRIEHNVDGLFLIMRYPSLYVLDTDIYILFSQIVFDKTLGDTPESIIQKQLNLFPSATKSE